MATENRRGGLPPLDDIRAALDAQAEGQGPGSVALVLLGFAFLIGFTVLAVIAGLPALPALLIGWIGSLLCVILVAVWGALVEERAHTAAMARDDGARAARRAAQVQVWEDDAAADRALAVEILDHADATPTMAEGMRDITPGRRRA